MGQLTFAQAAALIADDYAGRATGVEVAQDTGGVQVSIVRAHGLRVAIIRGSDELGDWIRNARWAPRAGTLLSAAAAVPAQGATHRWHGGFLEHAKLAWAFLDPLSRPDFLIGHSLGAACVQIIASSPGWAVPTIGFASPRPAWGRVSDRARPELVTNICRTDDVVCRVPPRWLGYRHVGQVLWIDPGRRERGEDHRIAHYLPLLTTLDRAATQAKEAA